MRNWALCGLAALGVLPLFYVGMTKELCMRIDTFTDTQIKEMKLDCNN